MRWSRYQGRYLGGRSLLWLCQMLMLLTGLSTSSVTVYILFPNSRPFWSKFPQTNIIALWVTCSIHFDSFTHYKLLEPHNISFTSAAWLNTSSGDWAFLLENGCHALYCGVRSTFPHNLIPWYFQRHTNARCSWLIFTWEPLLLSLPLPHPYMNEVLFKRIPPCSFPSATVAWGCPSLHTFVFVRLWVYAECPRHYLLTHGSPCFPFCHYHIHI